MTFRFTTRDLICLLFIAGLSCVVGSFLTPRDPVSEMIGSALVFVFAGSCYFAGIYVGKSDKAP
jgi:Sec-independent protein secretion pathway component TatC